MARKWGGSESGIDVTGQSQYWLALAVCFDSRRERCHETREEVARFFVGHRSRSADCRASPDVRWRTPWLMYARTFEKEPRWAHQGTDVECDPQRAQVGGATSQFHDVRSGGTSIRHFTSARPQSYGL